MPLYESRGKYRDQGTKFLVDVRLAGRRAKQTSNIGYNDLLIPEKGEIYVNSITYWENRFTSYKSY